MRMRVIAVGTRMSAWVEAACQDYLRRLRGADAIELIEIPPARRSSGADQAARREGERILALLTPRDHAVVLDERGRSFTSMQLSGWLGERRSPGRRAEFHHRRPRRAGG